VAKKMKSTYEHVREYKDKYPGGVTWNRLKKHSDIIDKYKSADEEVLYAFAGQKSEKMFSEFFFTCVVALTNKRVLIAQKRVVFGYFLYSITPDLYNDLKVVRGLIWGKIIIDTVKEKIYISNLAKKSLQEIQVNISEYMMKQKKKYKVYHQQDTNL